MSKVEPHSTSEHLAYGKFIVSYGGIDWCMCTFVSAVL